MNTGKILPVEAAEILNTSTKSTKWTYKISGKLLAEYSGKDVEKELEQIRKKKVM